MDITSPFSIIISGFIIISIILIVILLKRSKKPKRICPYCGAELEDFLEECIYCSGPPDLKAIENPPKTALDIETDLEKKINLESSTDNFQADQMKQYTQKQQSGVMDDISNYLFENDPVDAKIMKQLQNTTILQQTPILEIIRQKKKVGKERLTKQMFFFGSEPGCDILLEGQNISSRHAVIKDDGTKHIIFSLSGVNQVDVNGITIDKKVLEPGDVIRIADFSFVYRLE